MTNTDDTARALVTLIVERTDNNGEMDQYYFEESVKDGVAALREAEAKVWGETADEVERTRDLVLRGLVDFSEAFNGLLGWCRAQAETVRKEEA